MFSFSDTAAIRDIITLLVLTLVGAGGGYLSTYRNALAQSAQLSNSDIYHALLQGAAGSVIIVTLAPVDPNIANGLFGDPPVPQAFLKFIALGIIGGYAGGSLLESSASQFARKFDEIEERQETKLNAIAKRQEIIEVRQKEVEEHSRVAVDLAEQILRGLKSSGSDVQSFQNALQRTSPITRSAIAYRADENRRQNWEKYKEPMERSLVIFQALVTTADAETCHWWYASLGYCLKDKSNPDYEEALKCLNKAIAMRGSDTRSGAYEFNRAFCNIQLAAQQLEGTGRRSMEEQIRNDLDAAKEFPRFREIINTNPIVCEWLRQADLVEGGGRVAIPLIKPSGGHCD